MKRTPHDEVYWTEEQQKAHLSGVRSNELLCCPFCGRIVENHPVVEYQNDYFVCYHEQDCFMHDFGFALIPRNKINCWQHRVIPLRAT